MARGRTVAEEAITQHMASAGGLQREGPLLMALPPSRFPLYRSHVSDSAATGEGEGKQPYRM